MTALGRGLIFQSVLASLPYTQTCTYNNDHTDTVGAQKKKFGGLGFLLFVVVVVLGRGCFCFFRCCYFCVFATLFIYK